MSLSKFPWNIHQYLLDLQQPRRRRPGTRHQCFQGNGVTRSHGVTFTRSTGNSLTPSPSPHAVSHEALWLQLSYQLRAVAVYTRLQPCLWILWFLKRLKENGPSWEQALLLLPGGVILLWPHPGSSGSCSFWPGRFSNTWDTCSHLLLRGCIYSESHG